MTNFQSSDNQDNQSSSAEILYHSYDPIRKAQVFDMLFNGEPEQNIISLSPVFDDYFDDSSDESDFVEVISYILPDGTKTVVIYEEIQNSNFVYINSTKKSEFNNVVTDIFLSGDILSKQKKHIKNKLKYPHRFYGKFLILNQEEKQNPICYS